MIEWRWHLVWELAPRFTDAAGKTLLAAGGGYAIAVILGLVLVLAQRTRFRSLTFAVREFVELIRSTPLLLQVFFVFYVGPQFGLVLSPWTAGLIAIGVHYGAYLSEVYRGGIESVPAGQWEAAKAINLSAAKTYRRIVIPQALPPAVSGMGNYLVGIFKDTPMLSVIGVTELMHSRDCGRRGKLSIPRALYHGRSDLSRHLAARGLPHQPVREMGPADTGNVEMTEDMSRYPLRLEGDDVPMVRFQNVTKRYGPLVVLDQLDLDVSPGEMVTIIGPSGSGKTDRAPHADDPGDHQWRRHLRRRGAAYPTWSATASSCRRTQSTSGAFEPRSGCAFSTSTCFPT